MKLISIASDFEVQSQGIAAMRGIMLRICPKANIIDLMHGLPSFSILAGARTMETVKYLPVGCHVCVVDPGVGTKRRAIVIKTGRGDYLIGPDNGVLIPATRVLNGIKRVVEITNERYMNVPISPIFHGRDVFSPVAAHLCNGIGMDRLGKELKPDELATAPYENATVTGNCINGKIIWCNKFGSCHINGLGEQLDEIGAKLGRMVTILSGKKTVTAVYARTFGEVKKGSEVVLKDDYGRIELAINQGSFVEKHGFGIGDSVVLKT